MKFVFCAVVVVAVSYINFAESVNLKHIKSPPAKCVASENVVRDYGQVYYPPNLCRKIHCFPGGMVMEIRCITKVPEGCRAKFPECCSDKFICKDDGKKSHPNITLSANLNCRAGVHSFIYNYIRINYFMKQLTIII
ncbi:uncharacterized protein LOC119653941 [Hermetia illucens]|uniref:uncharacterized protein LOC119653941 n=1 Tax=Hermetia illucens TaxID=343691 RepID=UPI0018CC0315|nr:uncharacterized protein LOC119653941 [Hermetia illucens]